jgi:hypothetical protein
MEDHDFAILCSRFILFWDKCGWISTILFSALLLDEASILSQSLFGQNYTP